METSSAKKTHDSHMTACHSSTSWDIFFYEKIVQFSDVYRHELVGVCVTTTTNIAPE